jgi:twitching motility protein PilU
MAGGNMERVLRLMAEKRASDVYMSANTPILIKIDGQILQLSDQVLTTGQTRTLLAELLTPQQLEELEDTGELNVGIGISGVGSFRLSAFRQRGSIAAVFRCIPHQIPALESLGVPPLMSKLVLDKRGLILMVGATGTGKSTTLASMIEWRNQQVTGHILTIEDPIEFLFTNKKSIVNQREVGPRHGEPAAGAEERDAPGARLHPDRRDPRPRDHDLCAVVRAVGTSGAGHPARQQQLPRAGPGPVVLHARARPTLLSDLAAGLRAIVSQRLLRANAGGRVPAVEVLLNTKLVSELIEKGDLPGVKEAMEKSMAQGSQTFEQDIARLITEGMVSRDEGLSYADSPTNLVWRLQNDETPASRAPVNAQADSEEAVYTEATVEVRPEAKAAAPLPSLPPIVARR